MPLREMHRSVLFFVSCWEQLIPDIINLKKDDKFENFIKIDLIKEIEKVNFDPSSAMKFWGTSCGRSFSLEEGSCYKNCCYYVLWVNTGCEVVGC